MAAENLGSLKRRIKTAVNIAQIAKAMEMISASKIKRAKEAVENNRPYSDRIASVVEHILANADIFEIDNPYLSQGTGPRLVIVIAPDKGLCGALADNLYRTFVSLGTKDVEVLAIGKRAERFALKTGRPLVATFPMGTRLPQYSFLYPVLNIATKKFLNGEVSEVSVLYGEFKSMLSQTPVVRQLLPVDPEPGKAKKEGFIYTFEPSAEQVLADLLPYYVEIKLYDALINAHTSEQAARMVSMQNAKNNALDIRDGLTLSYNKLRQSKITGEILDITNSRFA
jgi:ATP synthase, F1 gamma subunit